MKKSFKVLALSLAILTAVSAVSALASCGKDNTSTGTSASAPEKDYKVEVSNEELVIFTVTTDVMDVKESTSMYDYMVKLQELELMTFTGETSEYGFTVKSVNGTTTKFTENDYWSVYCDFKTLEGDEAIYASEGYEWEGVMYGTPKTYGDKTYYSANFGVSGLPAVVGHSYALVLVH